MRGLLTLIVVGTAILTFLVHGFFIKSLVQKPNRRRQLLLRNIHWYSRFALKMMRISVEVSGCRKPSHHLTVCNHLSYLDMIVLASIRPSVFVTSVDMGQIFFLGTMAEIGGALFIERRHRLRLEHDIGQIQSTLESGFDVTLFPEGTSSDGTAVLPFKRSLLSAALNSGTPVRPVALKYVEIDGRPFDRSNHQVVCWYGKMPFFPHFFGLLSAKSVRARVNLGNPILANAETTKHSLTDDLYDQISNEFQGLSALR